MICMSIILSKLLSLTVDVPFLGIHRKGDSNKKASKERQDLEALDRELRTRRTELTSIKDKLEQATYDYNKLRDEELSLNEKKGKVRLLSSGAREEVDLNHMIRWISSQRVPNMNSPSQEKNCLTYRLSGQGSSAPPFSHYTMGSELTAI